MELDSRDVYSRMLYVDCLDLLGRTEEADRISRGNLELAPVNTNVRISHADHLLRQGRWEEAEAYYRSINWVAWTIEDTAPVRDALRFLEKQRTLEAGEEESVTK